jgi:ABC-type transport system substrate-binding protein
VGTYHTGEGADSPSLSNGVVWVGNSDVGTVTGHRSVTGTQTTYRFRHPIGSLLAGAGKLFVELKYGRTYEDRIDALQGRVVKLLVEGVTEPQLELDPAQSSNTNLTYQIEFATCASLVRYPDSPAPAGWIVQPEVAAALPDISADGRTYKFTIRPGYRFSPNSNEPVTAETFRQSIERALSPKIGGFIGGRTVGSYFVGDIQGERAFLAGKQQHISGLRAQGDTLTISLIRRSPDLLERLAMPWFCPVPTGTPVVPEGAVVAVQPGLPGGASSAEMVPSAVPYFVAENFGGEYTILKRNPNYHGPRPHAPDAIALRLGIDPGQAVARVEDGSWDGITYLGDAVIDPDGQVAKRWGPGGTMVANRGQRYYPVADRGLWYLELNAGRSLFSERRVA